MKSHKFTFFDKKLEKTFNELPDNDPIKKGLIKAIRDIEEDCMSGRLITKDTHKKAKIKKLIAKYKTDNIRVYNLPTAWRLIYSITRTEDVQIVAVFLDWFNHKEYDKILK
jgi:ribosomal protein L7Ae-like RNA K-turn-binding protein